MKKSELKKMIKEELLREATFRFQIGLEPAQADLIVRTLRGTKPGGNEKQFVDAFIYALEKQHKEKF